MSKVIKLRGYRKEIFIPADKVVAFFHDVDEDETVVHLVNDADPWRFDGNRVGDILAAVSDGEEVLE